MPKRSATKKILIGVGALVATIVVVVALLPMLISAGLGHGMIRGAIEDQLTPGSSADFRQVRVTWRGPQEVHGLRIVDPAGEEVADVNVRFSPGLFALVFGTVAVQEATIYSGTVAAVLYEDGSTNVERTVAVDPEPRPPTEPARPVAGLPETILRMTDLDVVLRHAGTGETAAFRDLAGRLRFVPARAAAASEVTFDFAARTEAGDVQGDARLVGRSTNLFNREGVFTPSGAPLNVELALNSVPVLGMDVPARLTNLVMLIASEDMAEHIAVEADAEAEIQDEQPSRFRAEIGVRVPFTPEGRLDMRAENIAGNMRGQGVPASLMQPFLANTPIVLRRDVGRTVDLDVQLTPADDGVAIVRAVGERAELDLAARLDAETNWWHGERLVLVTPQAHPDLVQGFTQMTVDRPVDLEIRMTSFAFPPVDPVAERRLFAQYGGTGVIRVNEPVSLLFESGDESNGEMRTILLERGEIEFDSPALGQHLDLAGQLRIEGADVRVQERVTNLFDEQGEMDLFAADFIGEVVVDGLPSRVLVQWMPEMEEMLREVLGEQVSVELRTTMEERGLQANLVARGEAIETNLIAIRTADALEILPSWVEFTLTPQLAQYIQADQDEPIAPIEARPARLEIDPLVLLGRTPREYRLRDTELRGRLLVEDLPLEGVPGVVEPVSVRDLNANFVAMLSRDPLAEGPVDDDEPLLSQFSVAGGAVVARHATGDAVATIEYDFVGRPMPEQTEMSGSLDLSGINVRGAELLMGREPGLIELWTGDAGALRAQFSGTAQQFEGTLTSDMPRMQGTFAASYANELFALRTEAASLSLGAEGLERLMRGDDADPALIRVEQDVPLTLTLESRLPLGFLTQEPFDATLLDINAEMRGGPLMMAVENERTILDNVLIALTTEGFSDAVDFNLVIEGDVREEGGVSMRGRVHEPVTLGEPMTFEHALLDLDATLTRAPTAIADALLGLRGYLTATVGPHADGTIVARALSRTAEDGGTLSADLSSRHGWLRGEGVVRGGALVVALEEAVEGELEITPVLRDRVLAWLSPLLGEVVHAEQPLHITFAPASLPLDGDITKLSGVLRITIGDVSLDPTSPLFGLLAMADVRGGGLAAHVEPIEFQIERGVVSYDRFIVQIDRFAMPYSGRINLATGEVRLRTALPLAALRIRELDRMMPPGAESLEVPLVTRGRLGEPLRMEIDPDFDLARQLLRFGIDRGLEDLFRPRNR